jgi:hypothetical protein
MHDTIMTKGCHNRTGRRQPRLVAEPARTIPLGVQTSVAPSGTPRRPPGSLSPVWAGATRQ